MFIIVNDEKIHRFQSSRVTVGRSRTCDLPLNGLKVAPQHCRLTRDATGQWWVEHLGDDPILINRNTVLSKRPARVGPSDEVGVGGFTLQVRDSDRGVAVGRALRMKLFQLQAELHRAVLDTVRNNASGLTDKQHRDRIEAELDRLLKELQLGTELEVHLAAQALRSIISDHVQGFSHRQSERAGKNGSKSYAKRYGPLIPRLLNIIRFDPNETAAERSERVGVLLPWALNSRRGIIQPWDRHDLATGLIREQLVDIIFGLGPLEDLMVAPDVSEVMVLPSGHIFVEREGQMQDTGRKMLSAEVSRRIVERIVASEGRRIDQSSPMVDARLARDGSRLNAIIEPVAVGGPALTIRRFSSKRLSMEDLIKKGTLTETAAAFLRACVLSRRNIVLAGGTGSGKTTLLNALASYIPSSERIVTVEDTAEIQLSQTHVITLQAKPPNLEGRNAVSIRELVRNTLRMRPDRIIVGECRGGEALDMLQAMNTGHDGSLTTVHANSPPDAVRRLEVMAMEAEKVNLPSRALREQIASAVDVIIQISRLSTGARRITSISEVVGLDEEDGLIVIEEIFRFRRHRRRGVFPQTKLAFTGHVPTFIDDLLNTGAVTVEALF